MDTSVKLERYGLLRDRLVRPVRRNYERGLYYYFDNEDRS